MHPSGRGKEGFCDRTMHPNGNGEFRQDPHYHGGEKLF
jgi:hypothetical protein